MIYMKPKILLSCTCHRLCEDKIMVLKTDLYKRIVGTGSLCLKHLNVGL